MTTLERLALAVSARLSGGDLVLVLDYAAALERSVRADALREALAIAEVADRDGYHTDEVLRDMIERERAQ